MVNAYGDLTTLKSPGLLDLPDDSHDGRLLEMLETASRWIDGYCGRHFAAVVGEGRFDGPPAGNGSRPLACRGSRDPVHVPEEGNAT